MPRVRTPLDLGVVIRDARRSRGWTQTELATRAKVSRQWVVALERGRHERAELGLVFAALDALSITLEVHPVGADQQSDNPNPIDLNALLDGMTETGSHDRG